MPFLNNCQFMGHLARNPDLKTSKDGSKSWAEFTLAVSTGTQSNPKTMWVKCQVWDKGSEKVLERCKKGDAVYVQGRIDVGHYVSKKTSETMLDITLAVNQWQWLRPSSKNQSQDIPTFDGQTQTSFDPPAMDNLDLPF